MNAIFTESINPFITFLLRKVSGGKKDASSSLIRDIVEKGLSRSEIVKRIVDEKIFTKAFRSYLEMAPSLDDFFANHPEYAEFDAYIDRANPSRTIRAISSELNPTKETVEGAVNFMSIHKSKGLEADYVFITGPC